MITKNTMIEIIRVLEAVKGTDKDGIERIIRGFKTQFGIKEKCRCCGK